MAADTPDVEDQLYQKREPVFPRRVQGRFRMLKWWIMGITLSIYYLTPWIRWDRGPNLPDQAVLIDLGGRRFFFFWIEIWPHEFYFIAGMLIMAGLGLFLFTSALGRVWCGYACWQTVWTDLFILVERWIEGDRNARLRLWKQKWNAEKLRKYGLKYTAWIAIAMATGGAWVFYFADAPTLLKNMVTFQAPAVAYVTFTILSITTFFFGGVAREQTCIYACPWPRIQAAMIDEDTITIGYRSWRGEPRGRGKKRENLGDCIDCNACVNVCPMGIDIRDGLQLGCITCGLCIDACDEMMDKVGKPRGLIGYMALKDEANERAGNAVTHIYRHIFRPRTILYFTLWSGIGIALLVMLFIRPDMAITLRPERNPVYVTLADGAIRNTYELGIRNKHGETRPFYVALGPDSPFKVSLQGTDQTVIEAAPDAETKVRLYVIAEKGSPEARADRTPIRIWVTDGESGERASKETVFNGTGQ